MNGKPGVLAELLDRWEARSRDALPADAMLINKHIRELAEARATAERLTGTAQRLCDSMLPTLVKQSKTNPNAGFIDWRDWCALYGEVNALRQQLAAFRGDL